MYKEMGQALKTGKRLDPNLKAKGFSDKYGVSPFAKKAMFAKTEGEARAWDIADKAVGWPERFMKRTDDEIKNLSGLVEAAAERIRGWDGTGADAVQYIKDAQLHATLQDEMTIIGRTISSWRKAPSPALSNIFFSLQPFIQTVDRIISGAAKTSYVSPVLMATKGITGKYAGAFSKGPLHSVYAGKAFDRDAALAMIALPTFLGTSILYANGIITGNAPLKRNELDSMQTAGWQPNSILIGDRYIPMRLLPEPMATSMQINATLWDALAESRDMDQDAKQAAINVAWQTTMMLATKPYLSGMNSLMSTMAQRSTPEDVGALPVVKKLAGATVPSIIKDVAVLGRTMTHTPRPATDSALDVVRSRAGLTAGMTPEVDMFGDPVLHQNRGRKRAEPEYQLLQEVPLPSVSRKIMGQRLSKQDYYELETRLGQNRKRLYQLLAEDPAFMGLSLGQKQLMISRALPKIDAATMKEVNAVARASDPLYANEATRKLLQLKRPQTDIGIFPFQEKTR